MLFEVDMEGAGGLRGYVVPDNPTAPGHIRVMADDQNVYDGPCQQVVDSVVSAGRHQTGLVGFCFKQGFLRGLPPSADLRVFDGATGLLIFSRNTPERHIQSRVFRLETALAPAPPYYEYLSPYFAFGQKAIGDLGQETATQLFHLKTYRSVYLEGRVHMRHYEQFLGDDLFSIVTFGNPFVHLAMTLAYLSSCLPGSGRGGRRDGLTPALVYFSDSPLGDIKGMIRRLVQAPKAVTQALQSPVASQLAGGFPGDVVARTALPKALDVLSQFSMIQRDGSPDHASIDIETALGVQGGSVPRMRVSDRVLALARELRNTPMVHCLLENDLILDHYVEAAIEAAA